MHKLFRVGFEKTAVGKALLLGGGLLGGMGAWKLWGKDKVQAKVNKIKQLQDKRHKELLSIRE